MPDAITLHIALVALAFGFLFGLGFSLAQLVVAWPAGKVAAGALVIGVLIIALAVLVK